MLEQRTVPDFVLVSLAIAAFIYAFIGYTLPPVIGVFLVLWAGVFWAAVLKVLFFKRLF